MPEQRRPLCRRLRGRYALHVITNNLAVVTTLANEPDIKLTLLGGSLRDRAWEPSDRSLN